MSNAHFDSAELTLRDAAGRVVAWERDETLETVRSTTLGGMCINQR
jgi:hypothetical protein